MKIIEGPQTHEKTELAKHDETFIPWEQSERAKVPWVPIEHGEVVLAPNDQKSNLHLSNDEVLQPRVQPIATSSHAKPLTGRHGTANGPSDEASGAKRTYPDSGGVAL